MNAGRTGAFDMKAKTSLKLKERTVSNKVGFAHAVVTAMTGNANFSTPDPPLAAVSTGADDLEDAIIAAADKEKSKILAVSKKETALDDLLTRLGHYVESTANGDAAVILSACIDVKAPRSASHIPDAPLNLSAKTGVEEGTMMLRWKGVKNARIYVIEMSTDVTDAAATSRSFTNWVLVDFVTITKYMATGLAGNTRVAFRVYAVGAGGKGLKSVQVIAKVL